MFTAILPARDMSRCALRPKAQNRYCISVIKKHTPLAESRSCDSCSSFSPSVREMSVADSADESEDENHVHAARVPLTAKWILVLPSSGPRCTVNAGSNAAFDPDSSTDLCSSTCEPDVFHFILT
jgi:hypothetical protein